MADALWRELVATPESDLTAFWSMKTLFVVAAMALAFGHVSGCASIASYEADHPYYGFPGGGYGDGGGGR